MVQDAPSVGQETLFTGSSLFDDYELPPQAASSSKSVEAELQSYLDLAPTSHNPLKFWHENRKQFKRLYKVSRQILCAPASQAPVERLFSISSHILSQRRLRISDKNFENIFLQMLTSKCLTHNYASESSLTVMMMMLMSDEMKYL